MRIKRTTEVHLLISNRFATELKLLIMIFLRVLDHLGLGVVGHRHSLPLRETPPMVERVHPAVSVVPRVPVVRYGVGTVAHVLCAEIVAGGYGLGFYADTEVDPGVQLVDLYFHGFLAHRLLLADYHGLDQGEV